MKSQSYCVDCTRDYQRDYRRRAVSTRVQHGRRFDHLTLAIALQAARAIGFREGAHQQARRIHGLTFSYGN